MSSRHHGAAVLEIRCHQVAPILMLLFAEVPLFFCLSSAIGTSEGNDRKKVPLGGTLALLLKMIVSAGLTLRLSGFLYFTFTDFALLHGE